MGKRRANLPEYEQLDKDTRFTVQKRDGFKCVFCGKDFLDIHEIVPRREVGNKNIHLLFHPMNRVCLCRDCHDEASSKRTELLEMLYRKYNYDYLKYSIFTKYLLGED